MTPLPPARAKKLTALGRPAFESIVDCKIGERGFSRRGYHECGGASSQGAHKKKRKVQRAAAAPAAPKKKKAKASLVHQQYTATDLPDEPLMDFPIPHDFFCSDAASFSDDFAFDDSE